ncbi:MAG: YggS family pyridoxal phosphate-dependent enzyme [Candidatus Fermentibacterota bacterium]
MVESDVIAQRLRRAREEIAAACSGCGRSPEDVRIMAVTKTHPVDVVRAAIEAGVRLIGENRVSEGGRKIRRLGERPEGCSFHMIGPLHRKEVRQAMRDFDAIDSVDRMKIAAEVARRMEVKDVPQPRLLVEVNTSGEESKHGFAPDPSLLEETLGRMADLGLEPGGLMTVGPLGQGPAAAREAFALLRRLAEGLREGLGMDLPELSMGMTDDFAEAVREGATTVRLGRYLFGSRGA